jgi:hypothetical protein
MFLGLANRIGLTNNATTPLAVEKQLMQIFLKNILVLRITG